MKENFINNCSVLQFVISDRGGRCYCWPRDSNLWLRHWGLYYQKWSIQTFALLTTKYSRIQNYFWQLLQKCGVSFIESVIKEAVTECGDRRRLLVLKSYHAERQSAESIHVEIWLILQRILFLSHTNPQYSTFYHLAVRIGSIVVRKPLINFVEIVCENVT